MSPLPGMGSLAPPPHDWLQRELRELRQQIAELRTARTLEHASIGRGGITVKGGAITLKDADDNVLVTMSSDGVAVTRGGAVRVVDDDGHVVGILGALPAGYDRVDGSAQPGFAVWREDGTLAAILGDLNAGTPPFKQSFQILDRTGDVIVADDTDSGAGLAVPWVGIDRPADMNVSTWPGTAEATWTTIASCYVQRQNPGIRWSLYCVSDALDTTGQVRISIDGTVIATSPDVTDFAIWTASYYWPAGWSFNSAAVLAVEAQVTAGTGNVRATTLQLTGVQT